MRPRLLEHLRRAVSRLNRLAAGLACAFLVYMVAHTILEMALRSMLGTSTFALAEFGGYAMAAASFLALATTLEHGEHIRVNLLLIRLRGWARRAAEATSAAIALALMVFVAWQFWLELVRYYERGITSGTMADVPAWIPLVGVVVGLVVFILQLVMRLVLVLLGEMADRKEAPTAADLV